MLFRQPEKQAVPYRVVLDNHKECVVLTMLMLLMFGKLQELVYQETSSAWHWALAFAAINLVLALFGGALLPALIGAAVLGLYAWGYFALLRVTADQLALWLLIFIGGALMPWLLLMKWAAATAP